MKSVLISTQPKWCELIANGKKTIEVRKTASKLSTPFKCYIYATKPKKFIKGYADDDLFRHVNGRIECGFSYQLALEEGATPENNILSGKVIGEFVCDSVEQVVPDYNPALEKFFYGYVADLSPTCLSEEELHEYAGIKPLYFWHISDLKIYDKPKELSEFKSKQRRLSGYKTLRIAPQSWCYVEEL